MPDRLLDTPPDATDRPARTQDRLAYHPLVQSESEP
jgi:hypothetical protein